VPVGAEVSHTVVVGGRVLVTISVVVRVGTAVVIGAMDVSIGYTVVCVKVENGVTVRLLDVSHGSVVVEEVTDVTVASTCCCALEEEVVDRVRVSVGATVVVTSTVVVRVMISSAHSGSAVGARR
jgi:hypothetical protein